MTAEIWTIIGVGPALSSIGTRSFTLLWRYIASAEKRSEDRSAAVEKRAEGRFAELKADLKAHNHMLAIAWSATTRTSVTRSTP